ncbi:MAG: crotonase/enoyl-CoA hydratase family protein [Myxococcales bacterium]|nr:crotonase/enoyl-CoA hydratase family protein [Myxococcales bacterium]
MASTLSLEISDHVATISIVAKTMPPAFFPELRGAFTQIAAKSELRAVIVRSQAKGFTYGLDLPAMFKEHSQLFAGASATERTTLLALIRDWQDCINCVANCPIPVIAAIHGPCIGGGIDLITACDIRLASSNAIFSVRETRVAIVADLGTLQRLPSIVGQGHARELALTGADVDATRAAEIGLINHVYETTEDLHSAATEMANAIASNPPLTVRGVKDVLDFSRDHGAKAGLSYVGAWNSAFIASEDLGEAVAAFLGKRDPQYKGK